MGVLRGLLIHARVFVTWPIVLLLDWVILGVERELLQLVFIGWL
jgi:hypothetical protein